ncbi:histone-lysine N-methyltransferase SETDB1-B-like [Hippoglossus hippoglossus]|uniref:histone-lysine N-methyltransferase SETDB1-B-like n=1 Tax=Hippoglossus hippoglossus TaxID=8267 RepID=UPI00148CCEDB|nr:histone-lysine N-methyltransferase SETDB1-B-like [Hippoglossus hippoglossus]
MSDSLCETMNETLSEATHWGNGCDNRMKKAVVVLTRLPDYKISALRPPTPLQFYSEDESLSSSDSDMQWEPGDDSDSDNSVSNHKLNTVKSEATRAHAASTSSNNNGSEMMPTTGFDPDTKVCPNLPQEEVKVDMVVLARRRPMTWQRGKIVEIVTKEDGRLKYKVSFEERGKSLVSGHHIAFDRTPTLEQLYIGAPVAIQCQTNKLLFQPGILAELPSRKNHLRFLVFMDDHTPAYVSLPLLHLVCRPLEDVLESLPDDHHKCFMKRYLRDWPFPHSTQYKAGQTVHVELNGVQQSCEVQEVDCSLILVLFEKSQLEEWIYRGSVRLQQHMGRILESKENEGK